jgi:hypothetical protein
VQDFVLWKRYTRIYNGEGITSIEIAQNNEIYSGEQGFHQSSQRRRKLRTAIVSPESGLTIAELGEGKISWRTRLPSIVTERGEEHSRSRVQSPVSPFLLI